MYIFFVIYQNKLNMYCKVLLKNKIGFLQQNLEESSYYKELFERVIKIKIGLLVPGVFYFRSHCLFVYKFAKLTTRSQYPL